MPWQWLWDELRAAVRCWVGIHTRATRPDPTGLHWDWVCVRCHQRLTIYHGDTP